MQDYYKVLGLSESASLDEVEMAYIELKEKYSKEMFLEGEAGNDAAKKLTKVEEAYREIQAFYKESNNSNQGAEEVVNFSAVEEAIRNNELNLAQELLDNVNNRNAEWHYLQSVIFYKKNWTNESKKQLEIAVDMDPNNIKYKDALSKLIDTMRYTENQFHSGNVNYQQPVNEPQQMGANGCGSMLDCCTTWCCLNLLCNGCCG